MTHLTASRPRDQADDPRDGRRTVSAAGARTRARLLGASILVGAFAGAPATAPARGAGVTVVGVVVTGDDSGIADVANYADLRAQVGPRVAEALVTVVHPGSRSRTARTSAAGRFSIRIPRGWLDETCSMSFESDDNYGLELTCRQVIGSDADHVLPVAVTLPGVSTTRLLAVGREAGGAGRKPEASRLSAAGSESLELAIAGQLATLRATDDEGKKWTRESFSGRWTLLVFSSPTCGPCRSEGRRLAAGRRALARSGIGVLVLSTGFDAKPGSPPITDDPMAGWPQLSVTGDQLRQWRVTQLPANVLVDPSGNPVVLDLHGPDMVDSLLRVVRSFQFRVRD